jgi:hypothetical protein
VRKGGRANPSGGLLHILEKSTFREKWRAQHFLRKEDLCRALRPTRGVLAARFIPLRRFELGKRLNKESMRTHVVPRRPNSVSR